VVIHTKHGRGVAEGHLARALSRVATAWTFRLVTVSEDAARVALDIDRVPAEKLLVIHNGIDVERFSAGGTGAGKTGGRAVTVGRLDPVKDQTTMLRAVRLVVDKVPGFRLDVVGDGPSRPELEALRSTLGLGDHVRFHGYRDEVGPYLASADFFVLSSTSEGVPLALLEAMASGLPGVATDVGGIREVIVPEKTGYLVPAQSPEALADAMLRIQSDLGNLDRMGRAARRRVEDEFSLRSVVRRYEELYLQSLRPSASAASRAT
jgi:glycosyltransferase involved in cell wall biosynthesis